MYHELWNASIVLLVLGGLCFLAAQICKVDRQKRIQVGSLMQPGLQFGRGEPGLLEDLRIRQKLNACAGRPCLSDDRKQAIFQLDRRDAAHVAVVVNFPFAHDLHIQPRGECIYDG